MSVDRHITGAGSNWWNHDPPETTDISLPVAYTIGICIALPILYIVIRVIVSLRKDKEFEEAEAQRKRKTINRILGKSKSHKVSKTNSPSDQE